MQVRQLQPCGSRAVNKADWYIMNDDEFTVCLKARTLFVRTTCDRPRRAAIHAGTAADRRQGVSGMVILHLPDVLVGCWVVRTLYEIATLTA